MRGFGMLWLATAAAVVVVWAPVGLAGQQGARYVGSAACKACHEEEYNNFVRYSRKAHSFESVLRLRRGLNEAELRNCYRCHTTGYGKPGGFVSPEKTPQLKNAGCEVCHGPGSKHVETQDPADIKGDLSMDDCTGCHNAERVRAFKFRPLIYGGAH